MYYCTYGIAVQLQFKVSETTEIWVTMLPSASGHHSCLH